ncbi:MAG: HNH endonuclease [Nanoarchaeota archaeon]|nr:HNH endonuclease [Nanoarchaeota archaeon]
MHNLEIGKEYTKEEIESAFDTNFGSRIKGITLRKTAEGAPCILLFSRSQGPYTDKIYADEFFYDGEGLNKDQDLTTANKALKEANKTGRIIYGFRQEKVKIKWEYLGILTVMDYSYILKNGFMTYEFRLKKEGIDNTDELEVSDKRIVREEPEEYLQLTDTTDSILSKVSRKKRDAKFSKNIKNLYDNTCVVCQKKRFTAALYPEVEAAHIYPKEKNGSDNLKNGIALCKLHHWAFDNGLFVITDALKILVKEDIKSDVNYEEIYQYDGLNIKLPKNVKFIPHKIFLVEHRKLHGFE